MYCKVSRPPIAKQRWHCVGVMDATMPVRRRSLVVSPPILIGRRYKWQVVRLARMAGIALVSTLRSNSESHHPSFIP